jgi:pyrroline-5-carboxylate reductase
MTEAQLGVIGGGNMAQAILGGVTASGLIEPSAILVSEPVDERRSQLERELSVRCTEDNLQAATQPNVLLAVKPQVLSGVLACIAQAVAEDALVISIAAGVATATIDSLLGSRGRIVRVMPNTPMLAAAGISAIAAGPRAGQADVDYVAALFGACGRTVTVDEDKMDAVTAVSGSGPAYVFYLIEAMISAGLAEGLDEQTASLLAVETAFGAARLLQQTGSSPRQLRAKVTSPNGTTQRAIETMDAHNVQQSLIDAIRAAADRSRELARGGN